MLAYCEARRDRGTDWDDSDLLMRRSLDGGLTWSEPCVIDSHRQHGPGPINNPVCLADRLTGLTHLLYGHNYARVWHRQSCDEGRNWSPPQEITHAVARLRRQVDWGIVAVGPGHGIQLASGRLLAPLWVSASHTRAHQPSRTGALYSDDHGKSWQTGCLVPDTVPNCNEATSVELADGRIMLNMRHLSEHRRRAFALSTDGGAHWSQPVFDEALYEPRCFASLIRHSGPRGAVPGRILFVNPDARDQGDHAPARSNLTLRLSCDEALTWPVRRVLESGSAGYADLAVLADGSMLCLYERGSGDEARPGIASLTLARFNLDWLEQHEERSSPQLD